MLAQASGPLGLCSASDGFRYTWVHKILLMSFVVHLGAVIYGMPRTPYPDVANIPLLSSHHGQRSFISLRNNAKVSIIRYTEI